MPNDIEYALMAGRAYNDTRADINRLPVPEGWSQVSRFPSSSSGFEAAAFQRGSEIVISFAGTATGVDWLANAGLASGTGADQLYEAAAYVVGIIKNHSGASITFTGHSLGGGLASLMGVFFDCPAVTFDQAPFRNSATSAMRDNLVAYLKAHGYPGSALLDIAPKIIAFTDLASREGNVTGTIVDGEALSLKIVELGGAIFGIDRIGSQLPLFHGGADASAIDLHSQALMAAFWQSADFQMVTVDLPKLIGMIFDSKLFYNDPNKLIDPQENLIERLVRHQAGVRDPVTGAVSIVTDKMLERFTTDLQAIAQKDGLTLSDTKLTQAMTAFAMQMYYEDTANAVDKIKTLFTKITGGLQFDLADVSKTFKALFDAHEKVDLSQAKGFEQYFKNYLNQPGNFTAEERGQIKEFLPYLRDWYVQAGSAGLNATDTLNRGAFMLGGNGADTLTGGTADDLLVGNAGEDNLSGSLGNDILLGCAGNDTLKGGDGVDLLIGGKDDDTLDGEAGNDLLKGGDGLDTYAFTGNYGTDIITDSDGSGMIKVDGQLLGSANQIFESNYKDTPSGQTIIKLNGGTSLVILKESAADRILINDWSTARALGITLQDSTPTAPVATLSGDFKKAIDGTDYLFANGNYVNDGDEANALDLISGTVGNDVIDGRGGDDALSGMAGDDWISGFYNAANGHAYNLGRRAA